MAMSEAFLTLSDPGRRAQYDKRLSMQLQPVPYTEVVDPFWTAGKLIGLALVLIVGGSFYYRYQRDEARLEAEKAVAAAKAKEAEEIARAEEGQHQFELAKQREQARQEEQQRRERDAYSRQLSFEQQRNQVTSNVNNTRSAIQERIAQQQQQREQAQAMAAARLQAAREKAELCRMERERYGRAISC